MKLWLSEDYIGRHLKRFESLLLTAPTSPGGYRVTLTRPWGGEEGHHLMRAFISLLKIPIYPGSLKSSAVPHTRAELEGLTGAAYYHKGGQESALHLGHGHDH